MATILLVGNDLPLLEGLAQTLGAIGHQPLLARALSEAQELATAVTPLLAIVQRDIAAGSAEALRIPLAPGGALVVFRSDPAAQAPPLGAPLQRAVIADLALPLERHRLIALVQHVAERAVSAGRGRSPTPPEHQPPQRP